MAELTDNLVYKLKCVALRVWGAGRACACKCDLPSHHQHPDQIGVEVKLGTRVGEVFGMFGVQRSKSTDNI